MTIEPLEEMAGDNPVVPSVFLLLEPAGRYLLLEAGGFRLKLQ